MKHRLCLQIYTIFILSLIGFTVLADRLWTFVGHEEFERQLFQKSSSLAKLLLPPDQSWYEQQDRVQHIAKEMQFEISLFTPEQQLIAASAMVTYPPVEAFGRDAFEEGRWVDTRGQTQWTTLLPDGRWLVIVLDRIAVPSESNMMIVFLFGIAILVAVTTYPFIRRVSGRLERLQTSVEMIGTGDLSTRVKIEGKDEVALLAKSFNETAEQLEKLVTAQRLLLANASHELRTPLSRIQLGLEMLGKDNSPQRHAMLRRDIQELNTLIHELMMMARLESGIEDEREKIDIMALVAEEAACYPDCILEGEPTILFGNLRLLKHLVRNLLDNAYIHGKAPVSVWVVPERDRVTLWIIDSGKGIPDAEKEAVFQPFYRAKNKQNVQGFGLGFPIIQKIAAAHHATIEIENTPKSAIKVIFPHMEKAMEKEY